MSHSFMDKNEGRAGVSKIYDTSFLPSTEIVEAFVDFYAIVGQLRRDCPWDREQTHESVKHLMIEETYEAVEAIDEEDWGELSRELGDLLLHVLFHSDIAASGGRFDFLDVLRQETDKLVRRHPHVFGDVEVANVGEVLTNWEAIKKTEGKKSTLEGVPRQLPALLRAYRIQEKVAAVGFDFPDRESSWQKVEEEIGEFKELLASDTPPEEKEKELGDLLFALVNVARAEGLQPENALRWTNSKFEQRFKHIEHRLSELGKTWDEVDLEEMDRYWDEAKAMEDR